MRTPAELSIHLAEENNQLLKYRSFFESVLGERSKQSLALNDFALLTKSLHPESPTYINGNLYAILPILLRYDLIYSLAIGYSGLRYINVPPYQVVEYLARRYSKTSAGYRIYRECFPLLYGKETMKHVPFFRHDDCLCPYGAWNDPLTMWINSAQIDKIFKESGTFSIDLSFGVTVKTNYKTKETIREIMRLGFDAMGTYRRDRSDDPYLPQNSFHGTLGIRNSDEIAAVLKNLLASDFPGKQYDWVKYTRAWQAENDAKVV